MTFGLLKNTNKHDKEKGMNNDLKDVPFQRRKH
jgi:hypothetical protein